MTFFSRHHKGISRRRFLSLGAAGLAGALLAETVWYEPQALQVEHSTIPSALPGGRIRMVQVSDLHLSSFDNYFKKVVSQVASLEPDLIVLTGDYLEEERNIRGVLKFLKQLHAPHGIYAVQGNWEYWSRLEGENLRRHFAGAGVKLLINERADLEIKGRALSIYGLDYPSATDYLHRLRHML